MILTNEEKARIFALYLGAPVAMGIDEERIPKEAISVVTGGLIGRIANGWKYVDESMSDKLILKPLNSISDEDANVVMELSALTKDGFDAKSDWFKAVQSTGNFYNYFFTSRPLYIYEAAAINQFLIFRHYAVPLYPYGKTAIELGLAIDATTL